MPETPQFVPESETALVESAAEQGLETENTRLKALVGELNEENARLREAVQEAQNRANRDPLTGLLNRGGLKEKLRGDSLETRPGKNPPTRGSLLILDIDNFKFINDSFGHSVGDEVIQAVSQYLNETTRSTDLASRWGGEEFVVIFDKTDKEGILRKLYQKREGEESGRARVNISTLIEDKETTITLSGGVTDFDINEPLEDVVKRADAALYKAKGSGRDRVIGSPDEN